MRVERTIRALIVLAVLVSDLQLTAMDSGVPSPTTASGTLSTDQVVDNMVRRNQERAQALLHSEATRVYRLVYHGLRSDLVGEMTVQATYERPSSKEFKVVSQSGSKLIANHVFKRLLESEKEAAQPAMSAKTQLNRDNYDFVLIGYEPSTAGGQYVLRVAPKVRGKYVYRGRVWVDSVDFAVTQIEAEPSENPSFWTKKSEIHHEYEKIQGFWLPVKNKSVSYIRLGGRATLTIEYKDYSVIDARQPRAAQNTHATN
jgi:membrane peptidoglycan carboxypeptidase